MKTKITNSLATEIFEIAGICLNKKDSSAVRISLGEYAPGKVKEYSGKFVSKLISTVAGGTMQMETQFLIPPVEGGAFSCYVSADTVQILKAFCDSKADLCLTYENNMLSAESAGTCVHRETLAENAAPREMRNDLNETIMILKLNRDQFLRALKASRVPVNPNVEHGSKNLIFNVNPSREGKEIGLLGANTHAMDIEYVSAEVNVFNAENAMEAKLKEAIEENLKKYQETHSCENGMMTFGFPAAAVDNIITMLSSSATKNQDVVRLSISEKQANIQMTNAVFRFILAQDIIDYNHIEKIFGRESQCAVQLDMEDLRAKIQLLMLTDGDSAPVDDGVPICISLEENGEFILTTEAGTRTVMNSASVVGDKDAAEVAVGLHLFQAALRSRSNGNVTVMMNGSKNVLFLANGTPEDLGDGRTMLLPIDMESRRKLNEKEQAEKAQA